MVSEPVASFSIFSHCPHRNNVVRIDLDVSLSPDSSAYVPVGGSIA